MSFQLSNSSAATAALAIQVTPTVSSYSTNGCSGTPLATWSGVANLAVCQATPGAVSLDITETNCEMDVFATSLEVEFRSAIYSAQCTYTLSALQGDKFLVRPAYEMIRNDGGVCAVAAAEVLSGIHPTHPNGHPGGLKLLEWILRSTNAVDARAKAATETLTLMPE
ncbi:hypothetical protein DFH08DRAFT_824980 [Mycena albidolilacea]|uniref:Uncharacterized protein n=1 Tax=Mycena albidolilacea TaxID=1033008 RepID=A0AAD6Z3S7_9AGAR|nr:hypothetical protein DFH08DRAFT_824980 [Mycena albidolilacea]